MPCAGAYQEDVDAAHERPKARGLPARFQRDSTCFQQCGASPQAVKQFCLYHLREGCRVQRGGLAELTERTLSKRSISLLDSYFRKARSHLCRWSVICSQNTSQVMKSFCTLAGSIPRWRTTWNITFLWVLLLLAFKVPAALAQANTGFSRFTQSFNPLTSNILFTT